MTTRNSNCVFRAVFRMFFLLAITIPQRGDAELPEPRMAVDSAGFSLEARPGAGSMDRTTDLIVVNSPAKHPEAWALQSQCMPLSEEVVEGQTFCVSFDARSLPAETDGEGELNVLMAKNEPWQPMQKDNGFRTLGIPGQWKSFQVFFRADQHFGANEIYAGLQFASKKQRIELRNLKLLDYGKLTEEQVPVAKLDYPGRADTSWREKAMANIAKYRQAKLTIRVVDALGQPLPNAIVKVQQQKHAYAFGTFVGNTPTKAGPDAMRFRQQTKEWFNRVTLPRYWADWGTDTAQGQVNADSVAEWAKIEGFELKTHVLLYPQFIPERVKALAGQPDEFRAEIESAMDDALTRTKNLKCVCWDALNELRDVSLVADVLGKDYYATIFNRANLAQPEVLWFINEYGILTGGSRREENLQTYISQIQRIRDDGGAIEGIGIQGHFQDSLISMPELWEILDRLAAFDLPIEVTEFDIDTRDEETQGRYTRDLMTAFFAHPATTGFSTWGFWEGDMWRPNGAMFKTNWSIKPNGVAWKDLVLNQWWTSESVHTDGDGYASIRAFKGTHRIKAESGNAIRLRQIELKGDSEIVLALGVED